MSFSAVVAAIAMMYAWLHGLESPVGPSIFATLVTWLAGLMAVGPALAAAVAVRKQPWWCALFVAVSLVLVWPRLPDAVMLSVQRRDGLLPPSASEVWLHLFLVLLVWLLLSAVAIDVRQRRRRGRLHWCGVIFAGSALTGAFLAIA